MTIPVAFVKFVQGTALAPERAHRCPCGRGGPYLPRRQHAAWHMQWTAGVPIPKALAALAALAAPATWPTGTAALVSPTSPIVWRRLAHQLARLALRSGGYDVPSFPATDGPGMPEQDNRRALLYRGGAGEDEAVVGSLALTDTPTLGRYHFDGAAPSTVNHGPIRPTLDLVFVAAGWRRHGVASALVRGLRSMPGSDRMSWPGVGR